MALQVGERAPCSQRKDRERRHVGRLVSRLRWAQALMGSGGRGSVSWQEWDFAEWNRRLLQHAVGSSSAMGDDPVERIPATPEELVLIAGARDTETQTVLDAFLAQVRLQLPVGGKSFCGFCHDYKGWNTEAPGLPPFFGLLWVTF